ncbi:MAG: DinB family protein [Anaerolineae bacterium]|nr:DinB family protein [Anaerolineae bacterium]
MSVITPERSMTALRKTPVVLNAILKGVSQEQAQRMTDGAGGWSVVETMCHIRDFTAISLTRARLILFEDQPLLPNFDPQEGAQARDYANQVLAAEFAAFLDARRALLALLADVPDDAWQRCGTHAVFGSLSLLDLVLFIVQHDLDHIEQIARTLNLSDALV